MKSPIIYEDIIDVRFSDLDQYNHVNSKHYLDFVSTARLKYMANTLLTPLETITKRGFGFYMTKSVVNYRRPIQGLERVLARSHVESVKDEKYLHIPFELRSSDGSVLYSEGSLDFAIVDLQTSKPTAGPAWLFELFFK